jgi:hypothetical protein
MSQKKTRQSQFLAEHPYCCFCGGQTMATTEDHIPARTLFRERQWPEGYVFPACISCNAESRDDEAILACIVRIRIHDDYDATMEKELTTHLANLRRRRPEVAEGFQPMSRRDTRNLLRLNQRTARDYGTPVLYSARLPDEFIQAMERYGVKLTKALFYRHAGQPVPASAQIKSRVFTNSETHLAKEAFSVFSKLPGHPTVSRSKQDLSSQFSYQYGRDANNMGAAFMMQFAQSFSALSLVRLDDASRDAITLVA